MGKALLQLLKPASSCWHANRDAC